MAVETVPEGTESPAPLDTRRRMIDEYRKRQGEQVQEERGLPPSMLAIGEGEAEEEAEEPRILAGRRLELPKSAEQLAVFGDPPALQRDVVNTRWRPSSDWRLYFAINSWALAIETSASCRFGLSARAMSFLTRRSILSSGP